MNKNERLAALGLQAYAKVRQLFAATDHADAVTQAMMFQKLLTRIVEGLRASGLSDEQIVSVFKTAAEGFAADTIERVEKRKGRKLSEEEIEEISNAVNAMLVETLVGQ